MDRKCLSSLKSTERISGSQDFALNYRPERAEIFYPILIEMIILVCYHFILSFDIYLPDHSPSP